MKILPALFLALAVSSCAETADPPAGHIRSPIAATPHITVATPLDWEIGHHERAAWSHALVADINAHYASFATVSDGSFFHPRWNALSREQRVAVIAEMLVWTAYYESAWDASDYSVDVGNKSDDRTWSVGLLQLSVVDQANHHIEMGYTFKDLRDPIKNLRLGVALLAQQIDMHGKILIPVGERGDYWSTLRPGGKHDKSAEIVARTRSLAF